MKTITIYEIQNSNGETWLAEANSTDGRNTFCMRECTVTLKENSRFSIGVYGFNEKRKSIFDERGYSVFMDNYSTGFNKNGTPFIRSVDENGKSYRENLVILECKKH